MSDPHAAEFEELVAKKMRRELEEYLDAFKRHRAEGTIEAMKDFDAVARKYHGYDPI